MKKIVFTLLLAVVSICASAEFRWGPTAGINISTYNFRQDLITVDQSLGFDVGVLGELMIPGIGFGIDLGMHYSMYGAKLHLGEKEVWSSDGFNTEQSYLHALHIPINLKFKYTRLNGIERYVAPFVYAGPVFSLLVGHNKVEALEYSGGSVMIQCGLGAELFENFQISGGYYWGMTYELRTIKLDNFSAKPEGWTVRLTYLF